MQIKRFEDIEAWKEARSLVSKIYSLAGNKCFKNDFGLKDQAQRAAVSCMLNIAEGFDGGSGPQFIQYLLYTRRSVAEVQAVLYVALDRKYISQEEFEETYEQARLVGKLTNGFITYLKNAKR